MWPRIFLVSTPRMQQILSEEPPWGSPLSAVEANLSMVERDYLSHLFFVKQRLLNLTQYESTYWRALPLIVLHRLAQHPARVANAAQADVCVVAGLSSHGRPRRVDCSELDLPRTCPDKLLVYVEDAPDPDCASIQARHVNRTFHGTFTTQTCA